MMACVPQRAMLARSREGGGDGEEAHEVGE